MDDSTVQALVTTDWLAERVGDPSIRVVDGSWHMPILKRDAVAEFEAKHVPGATYFNIDHIADRSSSLPHMVPDEAAFAAGVGALGISNDHHVVVYDATGMGSAPRVWWMFRLFGHDRVSVLDGGLPKWTAEGRPVESGAPDPSPAPFTASRNDALVRSVEQVLDSVGSQGEQVLDARSAGRFNATEPEPRASLRGGRIPGSFNRPFVDLYDRETKTMKAVSELGPLFDESGVDRTRPIVTSCGSGVTACNLALGLFLLGNREVAVYDGSWTEWGGRSDTPIES